MDAETELNDCVLQGLVSAERCTSCTPTLICQSCRWPTSFPVLRIVLEMKRALEVLGMSPRLFCSLRCSAWPIWEWWRLPLFWGFYQSNGGRSTPSSYKDLQPPWGAMGGGWCAITGTTWIGTRVSRRCIYIPHVSHLTKVIDRQTESFCHTKFSTAASCPVPSSPKSTKQKISRSTEETHGFPWVNNSFSLILVSPAQTRSVRLRGIKCLVKKNK